MERMLEADARHQYAFTVARRSYGNFSSEIVPVLLKIADWYVQTGNLFAARGHYLYARNLLSAQQSSNNSDEMIAALRGLARSFRDERFPTFTTGTSEEAQELAEQNAIYNNQSANNLQTLQLTVNAFQRGTEALKNVVAIEERRLIVLALARQQDAQRQSVAKQATQVSTQTDNDAKAPQGDPTAANPIVLAAGAPDPSAAVVSAVLDPVIRDPDVDKSDFLNSIIELADWYLLMDQSKPVSYTHLTLPTKA